MAFNDQDDNYSHETESNYASIGNATPKAKENTMKKVTVEMFGETESFRAEPINNGTGWRLLDGFVILSKTEFPDETLEHLMEGLQELMDSNDYELAQDLIECPPEDDKDNDEENFINFKLISIEDVVEDKEAK